MKSYIEKRIIAVFLLAFAVLAVVAVVAVRNVHRAIASSDWVNHTHAVVMELDAMVSSLHAGDAALRDYLWTGDARDQAAYREAFSAAEEHLEVAKVMTQQELSQYQWVTQLEPLLAQHAEFTQQAIKTQPAGGEAIRQFLTTAAGGRALREIRRLVEKIKADEQELLRQRDTASYLQAQTTRWTVWTGVIINFLLLALGGWLIHNHLEARRQAAAALADANLQLEAKVQTRTAELTRAVQALESENLENKWANQSLEHQLRYTQLIIDSISDLVLVVTKAVNISRINSAVVHHTAFEAQELIGQPWHRIVRLRQEGGVATDSGWVAHSVKEGREIQECPADVVNRDGQAAPARFSLFPLRDQDKIVGGVIILHMLVKKT